MIKTNWPYMKKGDDDNLYFEDGSKRPLTPEDYTLEWGKNSGMNLSELSDKGYLSWLLKSAVEKKDWFLEKLVTMRLKQLQNEAPNSPRVSVPGAEQRALE